MLVTRHGHTPVVHAEAIVASTATIIGDVTIGARCFIGHGAVIESGGPPVTIDDECVVLANAVVRSVGGTYRPGFPVRIGRRTLIGPACVLTGCEVGSACYVATGVLLFHGAKVGDGARLAVGSIVHHHAVVPPHGRLGLREIAIATDGSTTYTSDIARAHALLGGSDFFGRVFEQSTDDQDALHDRVMSQLLHEVLEYGEHVV